MDLLLKSRGMRMSEHERRAAEKKVTRLEHLEPRAVRLELEFIAEKNRRLDGAKRIEGQLAIPRKTFRAHADGPDVDSALDRLMAKLERQIRDHHGKRRSRSSRKGNRLESAHIEPPET
jgi:ribosomal subunit interface protein